MIALPLLTELSAARWLVPALAAASAGQGLRKAELVRRLGMSRGMATATLDALVSAGWLTRNPGHGHPLRPEYVLAPDAVALGGWCEGVMEVRERLGLAPDSLTRWSLPLVAVLSKAEARFSELQDALDPVSPRALSLTIKAAIAGRLVTRRLEDSFPPTPVYGLTANGRALAAAL